VFLIIKTIKMRKITYILTFLLFNIGFSQQAEIEKMNYKQHDQLIIRGVTLINGDGSPPRGPIDIVVRKKYNIKHSSCWLSWS